MPGNGPYGQKVRVRSNILGEALLRYLRDTPDKYNGHDGKALVYNESDLNFIFGNPATSANKVAINPLIPPLTSDNVYDAIGELLGLISTDVIKDAITVNSNSTTVLDQIEVTKQTTVKWIVSVWDSTQSKYSSREILGWYNKTITDLTQYAIIGEESDFKFDVDINSNHLRLIFQNNESYSLDIAIMRLPSI